MPEKSYRGDFPRPIEKHDTAAWAGTKSVKPVSKVGVPPTDAVAEAKHYVDENQK